MSRNSSKARRSGNQRKKKNAERFANDFGLDNEFGLNGQDFGVSQLKATKKNRDPPKKCPQPKQLVATKEALEAFADDVAGLWCGFGAIPVLDEPPSAVDFLREFVGPSRPLIIRNALLVRDARRNIADRHETGNHLSLSLAAAKHGCDNLHPDHADSNSRPLNLSLDDIVEMDPGLEVVVDATPDGHGDCVRTVLDHSTGETLRLFVTPEQRTMTLEEFRCQLREGRRQQRRKEAHNGKSDHKDDSDNNVGEISNHESDDEEEEQEEEQYDTIDGKRIYALKNSKKAPQKKCVLEDFVYEGCTPTNADKSPLMPNFTCNPLDDMKDLMLPCFMELVDNKQEDTAEHEPTPTPPPPPPPPPPPSVLYYSLQNDCFRTEMPTIYEATRHVIPQSFEFAEEAFGTGKPEAVNLWMGDERAVSSMHKDPYENLFYVASGEKIFTLCPPADAPYLYAKEFLSGSFDSQPPKKITRNATPTKRQWTVKTGFEDGSDAEQEDSDSDDDIRLNHPSNLDMEPVCPEKVARPPAYVQWIEADVSALTTSYYERHQMRKFPLLKYTHPIHQVRVQAGELLYLPALWFHRVTQSRETVGLNYWYNMNFNSPHWCYFQLLNQLQWKGPTSTTYEPPEKEEAEDAAKKKYLVV